MSGSCTERAGRRSWSRETYWNKDVAETFSSAIPISPLPVKTKEVAPKICYRPDCRFFGRRDIKKKRKKKASPAGLVSSPSYISQSPVTYLYLSCNHFFETRFTIFPLAYKIKKTPQPLCRKLRRGVTIQKEEYRKLSGEDICHIGLCILEKKINRRILRTWEFFRILKWSATVNCYTDWPGRIGWYGKWWETR